VGSSINRVILIGYLGADPDIRAFPNGDRFAILSLATSRRWKDRLTGEQREITDWHRIILRRQNDVTYAERYLGKGSHLNVEGHLETRSWKDRNDITQWATEVVVSGFRDDIGAMGRRRTGTAANDPNAPLDYRTASGG